MCQSCEIVTELIRRTEDKPGSYVEIVIGDPSKTRFVLPEED